MVSSYERQTTQGEPISLDTHRAGAICYPAALSSTPVTVLHYVDSALPGNKLPTAGRFQEVLTGPGTLFMLWNQFGLRIRLAGFLLLISATILGACGSSSRAINDGTSGEGNVEPVIFSDYEDFDPDQYPEELIDDRSEITHEVPVALLENRADAGVAQVVSGYRIQTFASIDRDAAVAAEEDVKKWLEKVSDEIRLEYLIPESLPVYNQFNQPLYRIRVGDFTNRAEAERVMTAMAQSFQRVFVVPDRVTVYR